MAELQNPEFWVSLAFCLVVLLAIKPLKAKLSAWGEERAQTVKKELGESANLRKQAEELYAEYKTRTQNLEKECMEIINAAKKESINIQQEADEKIVERVAFRKKEVQDKIRSIEETTGQDIAAHLLAQVMDKTKEMLTEQAVRQSEKEMDKALDKVFKVLEKKYH